MWRIHLKCHQRVYVSLQVSHEYRSPLITHDPIMLSFVRTLMYMLFHTFLNPAIAPVGHAILLLISLLQSLSHASKLPRLHFRFVCYWSSILLWCSPVLLQSTTAIRLHGRPNWKVCIVNNCWEMMTHSTLYNWSQSACDIQQKWSPTQHRTTGHSQLVTSSRTDHPLNIEQLVTAGLWRMCLKLQTSTS